MFACRCLVTIFKPLKIITTERKMMLLDTIITTKTSYSPDEFTGGSIQYSVSKYTAKLSIKLVLYFGFSSVRNPISKQIEIQEKDIETLNKELLKKSKHYQNELLNKDDVLDLEQIKHSYECSTNIVRGATKDTFVRGAISDNVDSDKDDNDNVETTSHKSISFDKEFDAWFEQVWIEFRNYIKDFRTQYGNKQKAKVSVRNGAKRLLKITDWESTKDMLDWLEQYIVQNLNGKYTVNLEKWSFDDFEDFLERE